MSFKHHLLGHNRKSTAGSLDFQCEHSECGKTFKDSYQLEVHQNIHRNNLQKCYFCQWAGTESHAISTHYDRHFLHPRYKCSDCEKAFYRRYELRSHSEAFHEKSIGRYKCKFCKFITYSRHTLYHHVRKMHK